MQRCATLVVQKFLRQALELKLYQFHLFHVLIEEVLILRFVYTHRFVHAFKGVRVFLNV